jgi:hypothetical protein
VDSGGEANTVQGAHNPHLGALAILEGDPLLDDGDATFVSNVSQD